MRILQLATRFPYPLTDGGATGIYKPTEAIANLGHNITFVTFPDPDPDVTARGLKMMESFARVELVSKPLPARMQTIAKTIFRGAYPIERRMMREMFELIERLFKENTFDLVHIDASHMGKYGLWIKKKYKIPVVLRQHNFEMLIYKRFAERASTPWAKVFAAIQSKRILKAEREMIRALDLTIAITKEDESLMKSYEPQAQFTVIPAGADTSYFTVQPANEETDSILWIGAMDWEPNRDAVQFFIREIFPLIRKESPNIIFDIVGGGTMELRSMINNSDENIRLHGRVPDVRPYLAKAKVLVCPLRVGGGMRLKLLDFFSSAKAVVSTSIGAEGNIAVDGVHLLLRDSPASFAEGVNLLLREPQTRSLIGANARRLVEEQYSWQGIAKQFIAAYEGVLAH